MKRLLIVVDFQNDFVSGSLGFESAKELDERIAKRIQEYRENNDQVIFTYDTHEEDFLDTIEGKYLPVKFFFNNAASKYGSVVVPSSTSDFLTIASAAFLK